MRARATSAKRLGPRHELLQCRITSLTYDFCTRTAHLYFPGLHCCNMAGAIALVTAIDPKAEVIQTHSGKELDTVYRRRGGGAADWTAARPGR
jgi:hypothetical protein